MIRYIREKNLKPIQSIIDYAIQSSHKASFSLSMEPTRSLVSNLPALQISVWVGEGMVPYKHWVSNTCAQLRLCEQHTGMPATHTNGAACAFAHHFHSPVPNRPWPGTGPRPGGWWLLSRIDWCCDKAIESNLEIWIKYPEWWHLFLKNYHHCKL